MESNSAKYKLDYGGSTALSFLCELTSLSLDQVNFISCQLFALLLGFILKKWIQNRLTRVYYTLISGICICIFCFGIQTLHIVISAGLSFLVIRNFKTRMMPWIALLVAMGYLSLLHIKRQFFDNSGYCLDATGPLMILTQKVTSLAFSIRDGLDEKKDDDTANTMTQIQRRYAVTETPNTLEYCSYVFQFQSILAGPLVFYRDYSEFIRVNDSTIPSPYSVVAWKLTCSILFAIAFLKFGPYFDCNIVRDFEFLDNTSGIYKMLYLTLATTLERCKYYHAWILADAICNMSGLGYDATKKTWDMVTNVDVLAFEAGSNVKVSLDGWNIGTVKWFRHVAYERTPPHLRTGAVYLLAALWHGFYPGYYIKFVSLAMFTLAGRDMRRYLRPFFLGNTKVKMAYDISGVLLTRLAFGYMSFAFVVQDFLPAVALYTRVYFFLHILTVLAMLIVPRISRRLHYFKPTAAVPVSNEDEKLARENNKINRWYM